MSPGIIGTYWLLGSFTITALWIGACHLARRGTRAACPCGNCS